MKRLIILSFTLLQLTAIYSYAQINEYPEPEPGRLTLSQAGEIIARPILGEVSSYEGNGGRRALDSLDCGSGSTKIVLYTDGTWDYVKDPEEAIKDEVYTTAWVHTGADPYKIDFDKLPWKEYVFLVDSTTHYHFPNEINYVTSRYGRRHGRFHRGTDLRAKVGENVYATFDGRVRIAKYMSGYGNLVVLRHPSGLETFYGHLSKINVKEDQWVSCGEVIGLAGNTGRSTGPHLHFEIRYKGYALDPEWMIDFEKESLRHGVLVVKKKQLLPDCKFAPESDAYDDEIAEADEKDRLETERLIAEMKAAKYHTVRSGDTLSGIARRYGTTVSNLCRLNGISTKTTLKIGRKIRYR